MTTPVYQLHSAARPRANPPTPDRPDRTRVRRNARYTFGYHEQEPTLERAFG